MKRRNYTTQKRGHAISLVRRSGWSYQAVARLIGCATSTVKYWCRKAGVASVARPGRPRKTIATPQPYHPMAIDRIREIRRRNEQ